MAVAACSKVLSYGGNWKLILWRMTANELRGDRGAQFPLSAIKLRSLGLYFIFKPQIVLNLNAFLILWYQHLFYKQKRNLWYPIHAKFLTLFWFFSPHCSLTWAEHLIASIWSEVSRKAICLKITQWISTHSFCWKWGWMFWHWYNSNDMYYFIHKL